MTIEQKKDALSLSRSLQIAKAIIEKDGLAGCAAAVEAMRNEITGCNGDIDYIECLDSNTLEEPSDETAELLIALAVKFGTTRLIDNILIGVKK